MAHFLPPGVASKTGEALSEGEIVHGNDMTIYNACKPAFIVIEGLLFTK